MNQVVELTSTYSMRFKLSVLKQVSVCMHCSCGGERWTGSLTSQDPWCRWLWAPQIQGLALVLPRDGLYFTRQHFIRTFRVGSVETISVSHGIGRQTPQLITELMRFGEPSGLTSIVLEKSHVFPVSSYGRPRSLGCNSHMANYKYSSR